ncbi:hypothetical protein RSSM_04120 [Rhodopirellula sallentina SM41]|uniref:Uncharacterized protein n=1 Tax=Rhodopirellula sallentina SM41 TaxID=1263870 RepID=M5TZF3_9BACT|nr:hypothetical protein RSSM_04120 [Rhodopirellula sallentina SM41]
MIHEQWHFQRKERRMRTVKNASGTQRPDRLGIDIDKNDVAPKFPVHERG